MTEPSKEAVGRPWPTVILRRWRHHGPDDIKSYSILPEDRDPPPDSDMTQGKVYVPLDEARERWEQEVRERLETALNTHARWAQEDVEGYLAGERREAALIARERERVFRVLANHLVADILAGKEPIRAIFEKGEGGG